MRANNLLRSCPALTSNHIENGNNQFLSVEKSYQSNYYPHYTLGKSTDAQLKSHQCRTTDFYQTCVDWMHVVWFAVSILTPSSHIWDNAVGSLLGFLFKWPTQPAFHPINTHNPCMIKHKDNGMTNFVEMLVLSCLLSLFQSLVWKSEDE